MRERDFDLIVYGATGFTGRLVAEYLLQAYGAAGPVRWAMAGRDAEKLRAVADELGAPDTLPLLAANANDPASLDALARRARVILTTVGPYQLYGEPLVAACVRAGTDYVDLCGEPAWMAQMIARYESAAKASGARIVFSCGFELDPVRLRRVLPAAAGVGALRPALQARARAGAQNERHVLGRNHGEHAGDA